MDSDIQPPSYRDANPQSAISVTQQTIDHIKDIDPENKLLKPIITPRFAPSCTSSLLNNLGRLAKDHELPIQTHISENPSECALVASQFPDQPHYAAVYEAHGLLTHRTVLAHAIHLSQDERKLIRDKKSKVSHCPVSNTYISSGLCPVRELLRSGIEVGLGTDVSGGWSPSILTAAREAVGVSRNLAALRKQEEENEKEASGGGAPQQQQVTDDQQRKLGSEEIKLSPTEALYLATLGGAKCLGLDSQIGTFAVGKSFDAQFITCHNMFPQKGDPSRNFSEAKKVAAEADYDADETGEEKAHGAEARRQRREEEAEMGMNQNHPVEFWGGESWEDKVAKWMFCGDDRNTQAVWVRGREVHRRR